MMLIKKILNKLNGLHYTQEYLCFAKESFQQPLHVYLVQDKQVLKDITNHHLFVGYCPLVFAFSYPDLPSTIKIIFSQQVLSPNENYAAKDALAVLDLQIIKRQVIDNRTFLYYEGIRGTHHFLSAFHQFVIGKYNQWFNKKPGNVFLHNNLYKQVQIAYAVPRIISLITIGNNELFNLFPTDLHGQPDETHYVISLRIGGKACEQVEKAGKLLLSQVNSNAYKMVYALGKNHMQELRPKDNFPFSPELSEKFQWPLPEQVASYKELMLQDSFTHGIHKILLFTVITERQTGTQTGTLAHINNSYATWRYKKQLPGNYLLR